MASRVGILRVLPNSVTASLTRRNIAHDLKRIPNLPQSVTVTRAFRPRGFTHSATTPNKMKAILVKDGKGPADNLYMGEEETPSPGKGQVQVKVNSTLASCFELYRPLTRPRLRYAGKGGPD